MNLLIDLSDVANLSYFRALIDVTTKPVEIDCNDKTIAINNLSLMVFYCIRSSISSSLYSCLHRRSSSDLRRAMPIAVVVSNTTIYVFD